MSGLIRSRPCAACLRRIHLSSSAPSTSRLPHNNAAILPYTATSQLLRPSHSTPTRHFSSSARLGAKKGGRDDEARPKVDMEQFPPERIRNLSIIAHIDHGKSTLADRLLQMTNTVPATSSPQFLDKLKVERERGITVKAQTVSIIHEHTDGHKYLINLIDTPGHVDFSYEVSRSLGACEGGLLLVDCTQGIQAQTLSVFHVAIEADLKLLAVINKVDLPHASPGETSEQIETSLGLESDEHMWISAKSGLGVDKVLNQIIDGLPPPRKWKDDDGKLRGLVFDTYYDHYRGVVALVRIMSGSVKVGDKVRFLQADRKYDVLEIGVNNPEEVPVDVLREGQVGYLICSMKNYSEAFIGDTICLDKEIVEPLPGFKPMKAMVYAGVFPIDTADFSKLEEAIERLTLNDRSVSVAREASAALSQGFRLGFLGTLHMDVVRQRLEDEYSSEVIITAPTVPYKVTKGDGSVMYVSNPSEFPDFNNSKYHVKSVEEPMVHATIMVPNEYIGQMMDLCSNYRATQLEYKVLETTGRSMLRYSFPLSEIVTDFFSELKSASSGFASFDYEEAGYEVSDMVKMNIMLNGKPVDALATIVHRSAAHSVGKNWCKKLKDVVPRQLFELAIQAAIGSKVVARETVPANRKDVTAGLYGGHFDRKLKHLNKQKEGKKRLKSLAGNIQVPQSAFFDVLSSRPRSRSYSTSSIRRFSTAHMTSSNQPEIPPPVNASSSRSSSNKLKEDPLLSAVDETLPNIKPYDFAMRTHRPLRPQPITPLHRSKQLSSLLKLVHQDSSSWTPHSAEELYTIYSVLHNSSSNSHILTPTEVRQALRRLRKMDRSSKNDREIAQTRTAEMIEHLKTMIGKGPGEGGTDLEMDLIVFSASPRSLNSPSSRTILQAEKKLREMISTTSIDGVTDQSRLNALRPAINFFLRLVANASDKSRFDAWWTELEGMGFEFDAHANISRLDLKRRQNSIASVIDEAVTAFENVEGSDQPTMLNYLLGLYAEDNRWDMVNKIYTSLLIPATPLPPPFPSASLPGRNVAWDIPDHLSPTRVTFYILIRWLAQHGHFEATLRIMKDMYETGWEPHIPEYNSIFIGFGLHGSIGPSSGLAAELFPKPFPSPTAWESTVEVQENANDGVRHFWESKPQQRKRKETESNSLWTYEMLQDIHNTFMRIRPNMRDLPHAQDAPSADMVWWILFAHSRLSGGDTAVLRKVWEGLDKKFRASPGQGVGESWNGWEKRLENRRLLRVISGLYKEEGQ